MALPVYGCVCFTMIFYLYIGANLLMVLPPNDMRNITGEHMSTHVHIASYLYIKYMYIYTGTCIKLESVGIIIMMHC